MPSEENTENQEFLQTLQIKNGNVHENDTCRSTLAQFIAGWIVCLSSVSIGMMVAFPTIVIGELHKSTEDFTLNEDEASWIGGLMQTYVGRKNGLILTFIPQLIAWLLLSSAKSVLILYIAMTLFGISVGSMEAPTFAYLGEITQPRIRGKITSSTSISFSFGFLILFFLSSFFTCRTVAAICTGLPIISVGSLIFIPDSPMWLLKKGRNADALKALCWLRGWVPPDRVQIEYENMCDYVETSSRSNFVKPAERQPSILAKLKKNTSKLMSPTIRKPFILITMSHFACHGSTLNGMRSYFIEILRTMQIPIKPEFFNFISSILMICGGIICFSVVRCLGKRVTFLFSLMICSLICISLGFYVFYIEQINSVWIPMTGMLLLHLIMAIGVYPIPWMLTSEVFPLKLRSLSTGLAAASCYFQFFIFSKTFYCLDNLIHLSGCFLLYGMCGLFGFVYLYFKLPETEGKTLAEIEEYFSESTKKRKVDIT